jgi:hypothetical protein
MTETVSYAVIRVSYKRGVIFDIAVMKVFDGIESEPNAQRYCFRRFEIPSEVQNRIEWLVKPILEKDLLLRVAPTVREMPAVDIKSTG